MKIALLVTGLWLLDIIVSFIVITTIRRIDILKDKLKELGFAAELISQTNTTYKGCEVLFKILWWVNFFLNILLAILTFNCF
jgi:hypothetical protein|nr:MAG TPA: hypothetical protein [Caudoviricetes sp.]